MSNLEHYFENLLFSGKDVNGDWNKNALTEEEQNAVEECAQYVLYSLFCGRDELKKVLESHEVDAKPVIHGRWEKVYGDHISMGLRPWVVCCSVCGRVGEGSNYCPECGAKMDKE